MALPNISQSFFMDPHQIFQDNPFKVPYKFKYNFEMVQWLASEYEWAHSKHWIVWLEEFAAQYGKLNMLMYLYDIRVEEFSSSQPAVNQIFYSVFNPELMDKAAGSGNLECILWLNGLKNQQCTTKAMDNAAEHGHLNVVQWLHQNRSEGCTTDATDNAAEGGHLAVVQWLLENRAEGCTTKAMDIAARKGHLHVVKWLHENRDEGCTTEAIDGAADNGRLKVVQFLHFNRQEGCTTDAIGHAVARNYGDVFRWLQANRPEPYSPIDGVWQFTGWMYHNIFKYKAIYTNHDILGWYVDQLIIDFDDFETVDLLLSKAQAEGVTQIESAYVDFL